MEKLITLFSTNSYVLSIATCFTIIGLPLSIILFIKGKKKKQISYDVKTNNLISNKENKYKNLILEYDGKEIENFSSSKFVLWNSGNEVIYKNDISDIDPLVIKLNDGIILEALIIQENNITNKVTLEKIKENEIKINLDYISKYDGIVLKVIHTGINSKQFNFSGTIKGYGKPKYCNARINNLHKFIDKISIKNSKVKRIIEKSLSALVIVLSLFLVVSTVMKIQTEPIFSTIMLCFSLVYLYFGICLFNSNVPNKFNKFFD